MTSKKDQVMIWYLFAPKSLPENCDDLANPSHPGYNDPKLPDAYSLLLDIHHVSLF